MWTAWADNADASVLNDGLTVVEAACLEALREGVRSADVMLNVLARQRKAAARLCCTGQQALAVRSSHTHRHGIRT